MSVIDQAIKAMGTHYPELRFRPWVGNSWNGHGAAGQWRGGAVVMGGKPYLNPPESWWHLGWTVDVRGNRIRSDAQAKQILNSVLNNKHTRLDPWVVFGELVGNNVPAPKANLRNLRVYALRDSNLREWQLIKKSQRVTSWFGKYLGDMASYVGSIGYTTRGDYEVIDVPTSGREIAHGGSVLTGMNWPDDMHGLLILMDARVDPSTKGAKIGIQSGGDYKLEHYSAEPGWYVGVGTTRIEYVTDEWQTFGFVTVNGAQDSTAARALPENVLRAAKFPSNSPENTKDDVVSAAIVSGVVNKELKTKEVRKVVDQATIVNNESGYDDVLVIHKTAKENNGTWLVEFRVRERSSGKIIPNSEAQQMTDMINARDADGTRAIRMCALKDIADGIVPESEILVGKMVRSSFWTTKLWHVIGVEEKGIELNGYLVKPDDTPKELTKEDISLIVSKPTEGTDVKPEPVAEQTAKPEQASGTESKAESSTDDEPVGPIDDSEKVELDRTALRAQLLSMENHFERAEGIIRAAREELEAMRVLIG